MEIKVHRLLARAAQKGASVFALAYRAAREFRMALQATKGNEDGISWGGRPRPRGTPWSRFSSVRQQPSQEARRGPGGPPHAASSTERSPSGAWFAICIAAALLLGAAPAAGQGGRATRPKVQRPDGPVWEIIRKNCTACHGIDDYAFYSLDRDGWRKLLADKHKPDGDGLPETDRNALLDWLVLKFGPDTKPFPRTYIPPEITTFFSDPEARRLMNRACTKCHGLNRAENVRNSADGWRVTLVDMRERGAELSDQELEQLVEWLARVWGTNQDK